ncbi:hypothetical protein KGZ04_03955, partial [Pseudomonas aeruginosa]|uniref:hypothetical protein n=1 Tax=Pseudomonas aeruginosa TaxID=287 RepID=UPI00234227E6
ITEQLVLFEVESTHRLGLASAEEDGRHFARATRALAFFNGLLTHDRSPEGFPLWAFAGKPGIMRKKPGTSAP